LPPTSTLLQSLTSSLQRSQLNKLTDACPVLPLSHPMQQDAKMMKRNGFEKHLEWSKTCARNAICFNNPTGNKNVNETTASPLTQENRPTSHQALSGNVDSAPIPGPILLAVETTSSTATPDGHESYERGTALKNVGLFRQAAEHFEKAAQDPAYALKGFAQMGLSLKKCGKQEEAVAAFRQALQVSATSSKEQVQILYLLGRTLESLVRIPEALEAYRWLRREAPQYRDVAMRIESLSMRRLHRDYR
jgi:tetratricopeptide (TPR) repeat protein